MSTTGSSGRRPECLQVQDQVTNREGQPWRPARC
jgi:hypothetical protein